VTDRPTDRPVRPVLTLASQSAARAAVLRGAGVPFVQTSAGVDEEAAKLSLRAEGATPRRQADLLAEMKATRASMGRGGLVLGADQVLDLDGVAFDKPADMSEARSHLQALRGRTHVLQTALVACVEGAPVWRHVATPRLHMRAFSDAFLDSYLESEGEGLLSSVGAYKLEGRGAQLFERIEGDYFSILGLPLLPLLAWLRERGDLPA
jgi:septum formation protein